ncbi:MAG: SDR family NAD(P)-dependent oxidoreductase [Firmicutes bacterium]|nr:SDR family NAD(P)-dependent oxidoreductase [Bacillota bacterium]
MELIKNYIYAQVAAKNLAPDEAVKMLKEVFEAGPNLEESHEVAIIGLSCRFPGADNQAEFWRLLEQGTSRIGDFPASRRQDTDQFLAALGLESEKPYKQGGYLTGIDEFDAAFFRIPPKEAESMEPAQRIFLETAWEAIEDAGLAGNKIYGSRTGIYVGRDTTGGSDYARLMTEDNPFGMTGVNTSILASRLAYLLNLKGPCPVIDTACSSSMAALHMAYRALVDGEVDMALAGGVSIFLLPLDNPGMIDSSKGQLYAFDKKADGTVWGEGVAVVLLKPLKQALRDKNHIYAVIKGSAINNDGASNGLTAPSAEAQADVIGQAIKRAKVDPETISYIEAHGTGTKLGDPIEIQGIELAYRRFTSKKQFCGIGTVKTYIGHLVGASGLAGLIKMALALQYKKLPATLNFTEPNPFINFSESPVYINDRLVGWRSEGSPRRCGINSFGFSGTNCHVILEEAPATGETPAAGGQPHIFTLSAKTENSFRRLLEKYKDFLAQTPALDIGALCYTVNTGRGHYNYRLAVICDSLPDLTQKLHQIGWLNHEETGPKIPGVYWGKHLVIVQQKQKAPDEIFEGEKILLSEAANQLLRQLINSKDQTSGPADKGLQEICQYYTQGADIAWELLYPDGTYPVLSLPTYPFDRKRYWAGADPGRILGGLASPNVIPSDNDFYYNTVWIPEPPRPGAIILETGVLILNDSGGMGENLALLLKNNQQQVIVADLGNEFQKIAEDHYLVSGNQSDYERLFQEIPIADISLILHLHSLTGEKEYSELERFNLSQKRGVWSLYYLTRALLKNQLKSDLRLILISQLASEVTRKESRIIPENAPLFGLGKVIGMEYSNLKLRGLDIDEAVTPEEILRELAAANYTFTTAYRAGQRYIEVFDKVQIPAFEAPKIPIKNQGAYIITGGAGGIGLEIGKYLASQNRVNLVLINRSKLPERPEWEAVIAREDGGKLAKKLQGIRDIERNGSHVDYYSADVSNQEEMARIIEEIRAKYGKLNGIIHSAGVAGDGFIIRKEDKVFQQVLAPKIQGTWILDRLTRGDSLDFFVLFSSIATLLAGAGQGDYTAANAYLDSYAAYRNRQGRKTLTINWPSWKETGMAFDFGVTQDSIFKALGTAKALECFDAVLNSGLTKVIIGALNYPDPRAHLILETPQSLFRVSEGIKDTMLFWRQRANRQTDTKPPQNYQIRIRGREDGAYTETETKLARIWGKALGIHEINIYDGFHDLGGDSIAAIQIINTLNEDLPRKSHIGELFEYGNIAAFAAFLDSQAVGQKRGGEPTVSLAANEAGEYDLSDLQQGIWLIQNSYPEMTGYNVPIQFDFSPLDLPKLKKTMDLLINRHEVLRTIIREKDGIPRQIILDQVSYAVEVSDLSAQVQDETQVRQLLDSLVQERNRQAIDITKPLAKVEVFKLAPEKYRFYLSLHHIMLDGWSTELFYNEFMEIYQAYLNGREPQLKPLKLRYVDCVRRQQEWLDSEDAKEAGQYWLRELAKPLPVLNLPVDFKRQSLQTFNGAYLEAKFSREDTLKLKKLAREWNITMHTLFCAAYFVLLHKITTDRDIIIGVPFAGRDAQELEQVMGLFINMVCIRVNFNQVATFKELAAYVRDKSLRAYENGRYPFNRLVQKINPERDPGRNPLFSTIFQFLNLPPGNTEAVQVDLYVNCGEFDEEIKIHIFYNRDLFKPETAASMLRDYQTILNTVIEAQDKDLDIVQIELGANCQKEEAVFKEELGFRF